MLGFGLRVHANDGFIASVQPSVLEGLLGGFLVVQIAQDNTRTADHQFTRCIVGSDLLAFGGYDACFDPRKQAAR